MDCHSRPAHKVHTPNDAVDLAFSTGRLDPSIPWVKVESRGGTGPALHDQGGRPCRRSPLALREAYPDPAQADQIINEAQAIYRAELFPGSETRLAHPSRISSATRTGTAASAATTANTLRPTARSRSRRAIASHAISFSRRAAAKNSIKMNAKGHDFIHIDAEYSDFSCTDCHTGGIQK